MHIPKNYTVESVTSGHPDKICDQISDAVLDECLKQDPKSRVAVESLGSHGVLVIGGEVTTSAVFDAEKIARDVYKNAGYKDDLKIISHIAKQSPDIAMGVDVGGAGDQGIMYGYATNETPEYLPFAVVAVHKLAKGLEDLRRNNHLANTGRFSANSQKIDFSWLRPDGKTQITVLGGKIKTVLVSTQHDFAAEQDFIKKELSEFLIKPILGSGNFEILVNPTGKFVAGGFEADAGLTGRKIMVDTYCGLVPHGGGCFSGKDPTKVDRSAAYMARFAAKNIVANGFAKSCLVSVAYAIGKAEPLMLEAENEKGESISEFLNEKFDFRPAAIIERLNLRSPPPAGGYFQTAAYGHFGKDNLPWEKIETMKG